MSAMTPEETPQFEQADLAPHAEAIAEAVVAMVERNAVTISKAQALAHKRHAGLAIYFHPDGHIECLVTHTVATGVTEHYHVTGNPMMPLLPIEIEDDRDEQG